MGDESEAHKIKTVLFIFDLCLLSATNTLLKRNEKSILQYKLLTAKYIVLQFISLNLICFLYLFDVNCNFPCRDFLTNKEPVSYTGCLKKNFD